MPRTIRNVSFESRAARSRLKGRHKPYFCGLEPGLHLGYRKPLSGVGRWIARHYIGDEAYEVETIATADDFSDADGVAILSFRQAQKLARERMVARAHAAAGKTGPLTVADVVAAYLRYLEEQGRSAATIIDARHRADAFILPELGEIEVAALTSDRLRRWRDELAKQPPRLRTRKGEAQKHREVASDDDARRARRASINRIWTILRAAFNHAFAESKVESDLAWRKVKPFKAVNAARLRYMSVAESVRLINAADPVFRLLVRAALETGCRYGELCALDVSDFNRDSGTLTIRRSKSGKSRFVVLTNEGAEFFGQLAAGRAGDEAMLPKADGSRWARSHQHGPLRKALRRARIKPPITFHGLRHTWASLATMAGVPLMIVAKNLGHSDTRMVEAHYSHLAPSFVADAIRKSAPRFGFRPDRKVAPFGGSARQ